MPGEVTFPELIDTQRLVLRRYRSADGPGILELVDKNRAHLIQNFSSMANGVSTREDVEFFVEDKAEQWNARQTFCYGIWANTSKQQIGQLQVKNITWDVPSAELSYFIDNASQRQGFATEAVSTILSVAFKQVDFNRVFVRIIPANAESVSLANKLGFKHEGLHRNAFRCGFGKLHDVHNFALTIDDFRSGLTNV